MNSEQFRGNWNQIKGRAKQQWGKLTDDDLTRVEGHRDELVGRIQERYGIAKDEADRQVSDWERGL
ncbi:CsbD family protein [Salinarimonas rosea]|uniref:CsbD family protein n=1 Tax=Salinarimonas rosea TaxID=552063 RepID=UPI0004127622|nr:CsbD family protein [Salinarimonas rosea]